MARILKSDQIYRMAEGTSDERLSVAGQRWAYCALDSLLTHEIEDVITDDSKGCPHTELMYQFELAQQGPALQMMLRGLRVDLNKQAELIDRFEQRKDRVERLFNRLCILAAQQTFNWQSPIQLKVLLYEVLGLKPVVQSYKGVKRVSTDDEALEKLRTEYYYAIPFVNCIVRLRQLRGFISVLKSKLEDGRLHTSFNIGGTDTGRWSSSHSANQTGTNIQNITEEMREIFVSDDGYKLCYIDLEQAESRAVAYVAGDEDYIKACESQDLHTTVCKMIWPEEFKDSESPEQDRHIAETIKIGRYSRRYVAKRSGHSSNYDVTAYSLSRKNRMKIEAVQQFQTDYFARFPGISAWKKQTQARLYDGSVITPIGRKRLVLGRPWDGATLRKFLAFVPQSTVADVLNIGVLRIWKELELRRGIIQILAQIHDALLFQYLEDREEEAISSAIAIMQIPVRVGSRVLTIPADCKVGYDWKNLEKYGTDKAKAQRRRSLGNIWDRVIV